MFISSRVVGSDGWGWLKTPDGWVLEVLLDESIGSVPSDPSRVSYAIVPVNSLSPPVKRDNIVSNNSSARHHPFDDDCVQHNKVRIDVDDSIQSTDRYARETDDKAMALLTHKRSDSSSSFSALRSDRSRQDYTKRMGDVYKRKLSVTGRSVTPSPVMPVGDRIMDHLDADAAMKEGTVDDMERLLLDTDMDTAADIESRISDLLQLLRQHYSAKSKEDTAWGRRSFIGDDDSDALLKPGITQYLNSSKVRRLEHMMLVQEQVQNITVNLAELSRSVLLCQQSLSKIIKGIYRIIDCPPL